MRNSFILGASLLILSQSIADEHKSSITFQTTQQREESVPKSNHKKKSQFYFAYKLLLTQPTGLAENYASLVNPIANSTETTQIFENYDIDFGHYGLIGVTLANTGFNLFTEGNFYTNRKDYKLQATSPDTISENTVFFAFADPGFGALNLHSLSKNDLYTIDLLLSYDAYIKNTFCFVPYIGTRYIHSLNSVVATFSDANRTDNLERRTHNKSFGIVMGLIAKYYFTTRFFAYGDYRYSIVFGREKRLQSGNSTSTAFQPGTRLDIETNADQIFELSFGFSYAVVVTENWSMMISTCYKLLNWSDIQKYQSLGLGVGFQF